MKQSHHQNPHEGIRIALPFQKAIRRALDTPALSNAEVTAFAKTGGRKKAAAKPRERRAK